MVLWHHVCWGQLFLQTSPRDPAPCVLGLFIPLKRSLFWGDGLFQIQRLIWNYVLSLPTAMLFWEQQDQKRSFGIIYKISLICPVCSRSTDCRQPKTGTQILFYLSILSHRHSYLLLVLGWIMFPQILYVEVLTPQYHRMWLYLEIESLQL